MRVWGSRIDPRLGLSVLYGPQSTMDLFRAVRSRTTPGTNPARPRFTPVPRLCVCPDQPTQSRPPHCPGTHNWGSASSVRGLPLCGFMAASGGTIQQRTQHFQELIATQTGDQLSCPPSGAESLGLPVAFPPCGGLDIRPVYVKLQCPGTPRGQLHPQEHR